MVKTMALADPLDAAPGVEAVAMGKGKSRIKITDLPQQAWPKEEDLRKVRGGAETVVNNPGTGDEGPQGGTIPRPGTLRDYLARVKVR